MPEKTLRKICSGISDKAVNREIIFTQGGRGPYLEQAPFPNRTSQSFR